MSTCDTCKETARLSSFTTRIQWRNGIQDVHVSLTKRGAVLLNCCAEPKCMLLQMKRDKELIGFLTKDYANRYIKATDSTSPYTQLLENGIAVVDAKNINITLTNFIGEQVGKSGEISCLRHNVESVGSYSTHDDRAWVNVYPGRNSIESKESKELRKQTSPIVASLQESLVPHEHYAYIARTYALCRVSDPTKTHLKRTRSGDVIRMMHPDSVYAKPIDLVKLNFFMRGKTLDNPQTIHVDSRAINFEVIAVVKCGNDGYELEYVEFKNYVDASPGRQFAFQKETEQLRSKYFKMLMDARSGNSRCTRRSK